MYNQRHNKGVTLIELLIAVAIVAIISSVSIPSYADYVNRQRLSEAQQLLSTMTTEMEIYFYDNQYSYEQADIEKLFGSALLPKHATTETANYKLEIESTKNTYIIKAIGINKQSGSGTLTINQNQERAWNINGKTYECWELTCARS